MKAQVLHGIGDIRYEEIGKPQIKAGWDFYDASQSEEFRRKGYKVVVPYMDSSWGIHDDGFLNLEKYNKYREIYLNEYK